MRLTFFLTSQLQVAQPRPPLSRGMFHVKRDVNSKLLYCLLIGGYGRGLRELFFP